jgi:outer membrane protein assembly factor BamB
MHALNVRKQIVLLGSAFILLLGPAISYARSSHASHVTFTRIWTAHISPNADSTGVLIRNLRVHGKRVSLLYELAANNTSNCNPGSPVRQAVLYALNAANGKKVWSRSTSGPSRCSTSGPVADPSGKWVYAAGLDGKVHKYASATGKEVKDKHWPRTVTLMPDVEKISATLTIHYGHLYAATSGFIGDQGHYEGHLIAVNLSSGKAHVFNSLCSNVKSLLGPSPGRSNYCSDVQSGLFGRGQGVSDPTNHDVYVVSGNGPWNGKTNWGDSVMKLNADGSKLVDAFTPANQSDLKNADQDLGSTGPAILPNISSGGRTYHLLVQGGKGPACSGCNGVALHLLNRDDLSGRHSLGQLGGDLATAQSPGGCEVLTAPAVWESPAHEVMVIYANDCGTAGYRVSSPSAGHFRLDKSWSTGSGGTTPVQHGGVVYVVRGHAVTAYNPSNGSVLGQTSEIGPVHWEYPLVTGGRLYITDESGTVSCFALRAS